MEEIWKPVEGYEGRLEVSNLARVRTLDSYRDCLRNGVPHRQMKRGTVMSPFKMQNGYLAVAPKFGPERKKLLIHRLVAKAFVPGYFEGATVNHKDGDKLNNLPSNFEWTTLGENTAHQWETGLVNIRGQRHPSAKLTDAQSLEIAARKAESPTLLAREYGISVSMIYKIRQGRKKAWLAPPSA